MNLFKALQILNKKVSECNLVLVDGEIFCFAFSENGFSKDKNIILMNIKTGEIVDNNDNIFNNDIELIGPLEIPKDFIK